MAGRESKGYTELMSCVWILRRHTGLKPLFFLTDLLGYALSEVDLLRMLSYLARRGRVQREGRAGAMRVSLLSATEPDEVQKQKVLFSKRAWNGTWNTIVYDVPTQHNRVRMQLVRLLHQMGFACQSASCWISPYDWSEFLGRQLRGWDVGGTVAFFRRGELVPLAGRAPAAPRRLWDLKSVAARYRGVVSRCQSAGRAGGRAGLARRAGTVTWAFREIESLGRDDPMLPEELLPRDWPAGPARTALSELRSGLAREIQRAVR